MAERPKSFRATKPAGVKQHSRRRAGHAVYRSTRWAWLRRVKLGKQPLCVECGDAATDVDHIQPITQGGAVWALDNLQSMCKSCHGRKTRRENTEKTNAKGS